MTRKVSLGGMPDTKQFWKGVGGTLQITRGNAVKAYDVLCIMRNNSAIKQIDVVRDPLLASLDKYFETRYNVANGTWTPFQAKVYNTGYAVLKGITGGYGVPNDSGRHPSPASWIQWKAGQWGAEDGYWGVTNYYHH